MIPPAIRRPALFTVIALAATWIAPAVSSRCAAPPTQPVFRAGAAAIDITPPKFPVIVNGYTFERTASRAVDPLTARALVLDDGQCQAAICVVDVCVIPRSLADRAKQLAAAATGLSAQRMLVAATHTHSAPSVMPALGSREDPDYAAWLPGRIAAALGEAWNRRVPARVGWTVAQDPADTHCRLWILHPGRVPPTPFHEPGKRILMCPPYRGEENIGPAGAVDAALTLLSVQTVDGRPLALLANYGMHFYHSEPLSADWCGQFARQMEQHLGQPGSASPMVAIMSQGTSGDQHYMDYSQPERKGNHVDYAASVVKVALEAYQQIAYQPWVPVAMAETQLTLGIRHPPESRLAWARDVTAKMGDRPPKTREEIYAREQILLTEMPPTRQLTLQALRVGELGITAIPCEVYGITGLKLKAQSPLVPTMNVELANGEESYIPPPEQHALGGYSTWEARTACLEVQAGPKIIEAVLGLLEAVSGKPRRPLEDPPGPYSEAVAASRPAMYWRLREMCGPTARDALGRAAGHYEDGVAFHLEGPDRPGLGCGEAPARAAHFAGGRMIAPLSALGTSYSVELWFWNGLPAGFRDVTGYLFSLGQSGDSLAIGGTAASAGRLVLSGVQSSGPALAGHTPLSIRTWHHVVLVRQGRHVAVYLDGEHLPEIAGEMEIGPGQPAGQLFVGGCSDGSASFEGKIAEVGIYDRALTNGEMDAHWKAADRPASASREEP